MMNTFQCLVLVAAIGFIITTTPTVSQFIEDECYNNLNCTPPRVSFSQVCCKIEGIVAYKHSTGYSVPQCKRCP
uniref:TB domain-containing protein n=1 Tax=Amphimedon queenslandica TaxID=400682 RepID=A0A1X7TLE4_AMPQE